VVKEWIEQWAEGKELSEIFQLPRGEVPLAEHGPEYRQALLELIKPQAVSRCLRDSEHGISGDLILGGADLWNGEEFSPWEICETTMVLGDFDVDGILEIHCGTALFVAGNLRLDALEIIAGEVHCGGELIAKGRIIAPPRSYISAQRISCRKMQSDGQSSASSIEETGAFCQNADAKRPRG
jgi:hypothetical protein